MPVGRGENVNYKIHIPLIMMLLVLQFFSTKIFAHLYLPSVEKQLKEKRTGITYKSHEYIGLSSESPKDYDLAYIGKTGATLTETYYSKNGTKVCVTYVDGRWQSTNTEYLANKAYLFLPILGFALIGVARISNMIRTGNIWSWQKTTFNKLEILLLLYGAPVFVASIVFSWLGKGP